MEEGKGERYLAPGRQYGNALLGVRHQEEESKNRQSLLSVGSWNVPEYLTYMLTAFPHS